jgi:thioredoxin 1
MEVPMEYKDLTKTVTDENFDSEVLQSNIPVLVDFWAEWCGPCKIVGPTIEALASEYEGKIKFAKIDVDDNWAAERFGIRAIPTVILFLNGNIENTYVGVQSKRQYEESLEALLG